MQIPNVSRHAFAGTGPARPGEAADPAGFVVALAAARALHAPAPRAPEVSCATAPRDAARQSSAPRTRRTARG